MSLPQVQISLLILLTLLLASCHPQAAKTSVLSVPAGLTVDSLSGTDAVGWSPDGRFLGLSGAGVELVELVELESGARRTISTTSAQSLAWRSDSLQLALASNTPEGCRLDIVAVTGQQNATLWLEGACLALSWPQSGLLVLESRLRQFSFGGNYRLMLTRPRLSAGAAEETLYETTLRPSLSAAVAQDPTLFAEAVFDRHGKILLLSELHDPPAGRPFRRLVSRYLPVSASWPLEDLGQGRLDLTISANGETASAKDSRGDVRQWDLWAHQEILAPPAEPVSPGERYRWQQGSLLDGDEALFVIDDAMRARFSPDGSALVLQGARETWLVRGLRDHPISAQSPGHTSGQLRSWRAQGLITADDYRFYRQGD